MQNESQNSEPLPSPVPETSAGTAPETQTANVIEPAGAEARPVVPEPVPFSRTIPEPEPIHIRQDTGKTLYLSKWSTRFWAWLIDVIMVLLFLNIVMGALHAASIRIYPLWDYSHWNVFAITFQSIFFFLYWTVFESYKGQSIGKMVMNIRVVNRDGTKMHYPAAMIESLGKSFLPVLISDCLIGWFGMPGTKLRLFNRLSHTIVIKTDYKEPDGVLYIKDKE